MDSVKAKAKLTKAAGPSSKLSSQTTPSDQQTSDIKSSGQALGSVANKSGPSRRPKNRSKAEAAGTNVRKVNAEIVEDENLSRSEGSLRQPGHITNSEGEESEGSVAEIQSHAYTENSELDLQDTEIVDRRSASSAERSVGAVDPVAVYMKEVQRYPLLSREKELELAKKYFETKDPSAAQQLVTANLRFVVKVAAEYSKFGARLIDLVQEGNLGLMHAVREFNPYRGVRLITYAVWWIRGYIQEYLMKQYSLVKIGTTLNQKKLFYQLQREKETLDKLGQEEGIRLLSSKMGIPEDEVKVMTERMRGRDISLNQPVNDDSPTSLQDLQKASVGDLEQELETSELVEILKEQIEDLKPQLSEKEKIILEERLLADEPLTLKEIGDKYGITREAVRQVEARLIQKIRNKLPEV